jgi:ABC-type transport system involved in multi-copper enzyme maturation permease subunit
MVKRLILKDWYFQRMPILGAVGVGAVALLMVSAGGEAAFFSGTVLLVTVLIALGVQLAMATVVNEHTGQTLPFVMSLPISPREYTLAKILANLLIFLMAWGALSIGAGAVILGRASVPDGFLPFAAVMLGELLVSYCLLLAVALVTESQGWSVAVIVTTNFLFNAFLYWVAHMPSVAATMGKDVIVWTDAIVLLLVAELMAIVLLLASTFWARARKRDFL